MEWPLVLGLLWLKKWNPYVNWRKGLLKNLNELPSPRARGNLEGYICPAEIGEVAQGQGKDLPVIPKEYRDLREVFSKKNSDNFPLTN